MREQCDNCGLKFLREQGYFLGSIYFNYGVTTLIVTVTYLTLFVTTDVSPELLLWGLTAFCVLFPLWFFRYARALWLGMDLYFDPTQEETDRDSAARDGEQRERASLPREAVGRREGTPRRDSSRRPE